MTRGREIRCLLPLSVLIWIGLWGLESGTAQGAVLPSQDAFHYRLFADGRHDANYIEWWYFNFFDSDQDIEAIFTYFIADPEAHSQLAVAQMAAVAYTPDGNVVATDAYGTDQFSASYEQADVVLAGNGIEVLGAGTYRIFGASQDGRLSWDLVFVRASPSWFAADRMAVGSASWELMSWLVYMPGARVSGKLEMDGRLYSIDAPGYHDHNWGEWIFTDALWNWAQYFQPDLALGLGDFIDHPAGVASVEFGGRRTVFLKNQYQLMHTRWAFDGQNRKLYPIASLLWAENEGRRLLVAIEAIETVALRGEFSFPLPDPIIYEQTARYRGLLWEKNDQGEWLRRTTFAGNGFKEYTARSFRKSLPAR
ncbi:MAG: hypothetical protein ACE5JX_05935 [Acidobacteriota bacterium]